jgi:hypothetical protein
MLELAYVNPDPPHVKCIVTIQEIFPSVSWQPKLLLVELTDAERPGYKFRRPWEIVDGGRQYPLSFHDAINTLSKEEFVVWSLKETENVDPDPAA